VVPGSWFGKDGNWKLEAGSWNKDRKQIIKNKNKNKNKKENEKGI
jgi:hypothetical protein